MTPAAKEDAEVVAVGSNIETFCAVDSKADRGKRDFKNLELVDANPPWGAIDRLSFAGQLVKRYAVFLDGRNHWGNLVELTRELLEGSLAENIARFGDVDMAQVEAAARLVGLHELIMAMPQGYNSPIGRDGAILSGGQRQRVGLARALYGKPVFVVLDEPNSSLDEAGDAALANAIASLKQLGTTFVVMTHRTSVLGVADKMLLMRDGAQQAFGPRDEVLAVLQKARQPQVQAAPAAPVAVAPDANAAPTAA